ncbi:CDP-diacylglycerol--glycerol-3-phosphate 3-phosphatidyltransferase [Anoxybacter fermentans]|uniref:CDP-diacylglycerol--glycerol-3-phosphate 3-phosphatidyltransferase n=1 Tax=Anoxybacter fermentans TaxID=1323375 RepID=A0A3S9SWC1_9FIRM|nr:CDP-diacylglycerol--glycerol-3-phosphate 3-phosphatidyltransferase [Anoxybacter fermentans]AZR72552.1 CDP-diacylglycerol--glycerol-3-phosphate 3-phosphatidyltransferase [Anoxybacter fermentans]
MNLPNKLSLLRIILVPLFLIFLLVKFNMPYGEYAKYIAIFIFVIAALTDSLDGYIARKHGLITKLGKLIDPLADKMLISGALIALVSLGEVSAWPAFIIITREFAVTGLRAIASAEGVVIAASIWGKMKTISQIIAILAVMIDISIFKIPFDAHEILIWIATFITIISGLDYMIKGWHILRSEKH